MSGVVASPSVSIENAAEIDQNIIDDMQAKTVADYTLKKSLQAVNMSQRFRQSDKDGTVDVDPELLFQRLIAILLSSRQINTDVDLSNLFSCSLCPYPAALASSPLKMLEQREKSTLSKYYFKSKFTYYLLGIVGKNKRHLEKLLIPVSVLC